MRVDAPNARASDPLSSRIAGNDITRSGARKKQVAQVAALVARYPGSTSRELAEIGGLDRHMVGRRCPDAEVAQLITRGELRKCHYAGKVAVTWWPTGETEAMKDEVSMYVDMVMNGGSLETRRAIIEESVPFHLRDKVKARVAAEWAKRRATKKGAK